MSLRANLTLIEPKFGPWGPDQTPKLGLVWSFFLDLSLIPKLDSFFGHTNLICDPEAHPNPILDLIMPTKLLLPPSLIFEWCDISAVRIIFIY